MEPPYVLMPHSLGGWAARVFTAAYPDEVAGIVFIDSSHPDQVARHRAILPPVRPDEDPGIAFASAGNESLVTTPPGAEIGWLDLVTAADEARASGDLGDRPVIVLTADQKLEELPEPYRSATPMPGSRCSRSWHRCPRAGSSGPSPTPATSSRLTSPRRSSRPIREVQAAIAEGPGTWPGVDPGTVTSPSPGG